MGTSVNNCRLVKQCPCLFEAEWNKIRCRLISVWLVFNFLVYQWSIIYSILFNTVWLLHHKMCNHLCRNSILSIKVSNAYKDKAVFYCKSHTNTHFDMYMTAGVGSSTVATHNNRRSGKDNGWMLLKLYYDYIIILIFPDNHGQVNVGKINKTIIKLS